MRTKPSRDWLEPLRRLPLFRDLNDRDVARVDRLMTPVDVHAGQVLTTEGTTGLQAFIIISGSAEVTIAGRLVAVVGPGEVIGEMALVDHQLRTATVTATEAMRVFVIDPRCFASLLAEAGFARRVLDTEVTRLSAANASHAELANA